MNEIRTCARSLERAGVCCIDECDEAAAWAVLEPFSVTEHATCRLHGRAYAHRKPLKWSPLWAPTEGRQ